MFLEGGNVMEKIYRINMTNQTVKIEPVPEKYELVGGRGLIGHIMNDEVDPLCHPLGPNNKLIIATGVLCGTTAPCSGRISFGAKSPLTNGIKESNAGGPTGQMLAKMGIKAVIIEGKPDVSEDQFFILRITPAGIEIMAAPQEIIGKGCYETGRYCKEKYSYSHTASVLTIGQAGEMRGAAACISLTNMEGDSSRQAGRGGLGAVMGAKKIKAIVVDNRGQNSITYVHPEAFREKAHELGKALIVAGAGLNAYGTAVLVTPVNGVGGLPVKNFSEGAWDRFDKITGQEIHRLADERGGKWGHSCHPGCCIRCSNVVADKDGNYVTGSLEFETVALFGSNCLIDDLDCIARCDYKCDDFGVDSIDTSVAAGIAMEAGLIEWGDTAGLEAFVDEIGKKSVLGRVIASGATVFGKVFGQWRVSATKGQATAAYDPRGCKGTGATYATSTMGGDHTVGNALPGRGGIDSKSVEKQAGLVRNLQAYSAYMMDSTGFCLFVGPSVTKAQPTADLINAKYGTSLTPENIYQMGIEILKMEIAFNRAAGVPDIDIPDFEKTEPLGPHNHVFDVPLEDLKKIHDFDYKFPEDKQAIW
jgi:aldehyde:ferredoxin oxidoreductase